MTASSSSQKLDPQTVVDAIQSWSALREVQPPPFDPSSDLAQDGAASPRYQVGHSAWAGIVGAIDHLDAMQRAITKAHVLHTYAPFALIRAGMENAAQALWLLGPDDREVRLTRVLHLAHENLKQEDSARRLHPRPPAQQRSPAELMRDVIDLAKSLGLNTKAVARSFGHEHVVREAAEHAAVAPDLTVYLWKVCSAHAHGRQWASLQTLKQEVQDSGIEGVATVRFTTNVDQVMLVASMAVVLNQKAQLLYEQRRHPPTA